jgi:iron complex outermembrane receptor protein
MDSAASASCPKRALFYANSFFDPPRRDALAGLQQQLYRARAEHDEPQLCADGQEPLDPLAFTAMEFETSARQTTRRTGSLMLDFKADDRLTLSLLGIVFAATSIRTSPT